METPDVTLTFQTRNRAPQLRVALESLAQGAELSINTLVVDDATDIEWLPKKRAVVRKYTNCRMLENIRKQGSTQLYNQSIMGAPTRWVIFANDDVIFSPEFPAKVAEHIEAGYHVFHYANSACFMVDKLALLTTGWVGDERYPHWHWEDTDFSLRVQHARDQGKLKIGSSTFEYVRHNQGVHMGTGREREKGPGAEANWQVFMKLWQLPGTDPSEAKPGGKVGEINWHPWEMKFIETFYKKHEDTDDSGH
jgi:hypothetical protein